MSNRLLEYTIINRKINKIGLKYLVEIIYWKGFEE
jgi:hypothetical protein